MESCWPLSNLPSSTTVRHACLWYDRSDLDRLADDRVRVRLTLRSAQRCLVQI